MIRVVLDTNVIVSGLASFDNLDRAPARVLRLVLQEKLELITSGAILREVSKTLSNPYFVQRVNRATTASIESLLLKQSLGSYEGVAIMNPSEFLALLESQE